jgi:hypothetical protein
MDMADILKKGMVHFNDLYSYFSELTEEKDISCDESEGKKDITTAPKDVMEISAVLSNRHAFHFLYF